MQRFKVLKVVLKFTFIDETFLSYLVSFHSSCLHASCHFDFSVLRFLVRVSPPRV